jgi:hypothetical protein
MASFGNPVKFFAIIFEKGSFERSSFERSRFEPSSVKEI